MKLQLCGWKICKLVWRPQKCWQRYWSDVAILEAWFEGDQNDARDLVGGFRYGGYCEGAGAKYLDKSWQILTKYIERLFGLNARGKIVRATSAMEPALSSRKKKIQRSCFTVFNGQLRGEHRDASIGRDTPRFGQVMCWVRLKKWKSEENCLIAQVKLFKYVSISNMMERLQDQEPGQFV